MSDVCVRRCAPLLFLLVFGACGPASEEGQVDAGTPAPAAASAAKHAPRTRRAHANAPASFKRDRSGGVRDAGNFVVEYEETDNENYQELEGIFQETRLLEDTVAELNKVFFLPGDVPVVLRECGEVNAFYDPEAQEISVCYELIEYYSGMFLSEDQTEEEAAEGGEAVAGATLFTFFHELGHALIDLYDLPVTGREEDAVDQLATMILLEGGDEGETAALNGAWSFLTEEEEDDSEEEPAFWDEHSLDEQRFYNIVCWSYGKNPEAFQELVDDETLPEGRAARCPAEYDRMSRSWDALLDPYVKG
ncbi:MAG: DUF4344 domain-containing metallopeptidase [Thermoanaerobaculia bacterium]